MSDFKKRFGFFRTNTSGEPSSSAPQTEFLEVDPDIKGGATADVNAFDGAEIIASDVRRMSNVEAEANRRLKMYRREHQFDPNLPDDAFEAIDATTGAHDAKGEAELVGEFVENSPYPEGMFLLLLMPGEMRKSANLE